MQSVLGQRGTCAGLKSLQGHPADANEQLHVVGNQVDAAWEPAKAAMARAGTLLQVGLLPGHKADVALQQPARQLCGCVQPGYKHCGLEPWVGVVGALSGVGCLDACEASMSRSGVDEALAGTAAVVGLLGLSDSLAAPACGQS